MASNSKIEWCDHTFNPWRGCTKVSDGCKNCYAETLSKRNPKALGVWGPRGQRVLAAEAYWRLPVAWNKAAACIQSFDCGHGEHSDACPQAVRPRVFCASLADVFEGLETMPEASHEPVEAARHRLFNLIHETPNLDWLILTKRPDNANAWIGGTSGAGLATFRENFPNVWLGTSVEDQAAADERIPHLLRCPAAVRFLSCEPLLSAVDLMLVHDGPYTLSPLTGDWTCHDEAMDDPCGRDSGERIHWVIVGGESGPGARPMHPDWARSIRDQCQAAGVAFHFKQWGEWAPSFQAKYPAPVDGLKGLPARHEFKDDPMKLGVATSWRLGKKAAGRLLDGRTWDEFPDPKERSDG